MHLRTNRRRWLVAAATLVLASLAAVVVALLTPAPSRATIGENMTVKLYQGGQVVQQWTAQFPGRMEGDSFVFTVRNQGTSRQIRLRGAFVAEQQ